MTTRKPKGRPANSAVLAMCDRYWAANYLVPRRTYDHVQNFWAGHMFTLALRAYMAGKRNGAKRVRGR